MPTNESTMKWKVDVAQLKAGMADAKRSISLANAEFKTATAGLDKWSTSITGMEAKLKQLNAVLPQQKSILAQLQKQYEIVAKSLGADSTEAQRLRIQIENQQASIAKTEASISKYTDQLDAMKDEQSKADSELGKLTKTITEQESKLNDLKEAYTNAVLLYGKNSDEAKGLAAQISDLSGELQDNKKKLQDAESAANDLDKTFDDTEKSTDDLKEGFTVMKGALADLVAQGINKAIEGLKNLAKEAYAAWEEFDNGADNITAMTGATGEAADELMKAYDNVSSGVVGSFDEIGKAIGEVNTRFGLTGKDLEKTADIFLKFAKINGVDVTSSIDSVQSAMTAFGLRAEDASAVLDLLNTVGQETGTSMNQLSSMIMSNAPALQEMGFTIEDSAQFLGNLSKNGLDAGTTLGALKKALANAAKEGVPMAEALEDIQSSILSASSETEAMTAAIDLFGTRSGPAIAKAVRSGRLSFKNFGRTLDDFRGNVETTYDAMLDAPDEIALAVQNLRKTAAKAVDNFLKKHGAAITKAIDTFTSKGLPAMEKGVGAFFKFIEQNGDTIVGVLKAIATAFITYKAVTTIESVIGAFKNLHGAIKAGQSVMEAFNGTLSMSPIGLASMAIGAMVSAVISYNKSVDEASQGIKALSEEEQALIDKINEGAEAYQQSRESRLEDNKAIESSYSYYENLWTRLDEITTKQGGIQTGYEDEAKVIMNELSEGLGVEFDLRGWQIKNYQDIAKEIDNIILKKKAEAMISANEGAYTEAITKQADAFADYNQAVSDAEATHRELADAQAVVTEMEEKMSAGQKVNMFKYNNAKQAVSDLEKAYKEQSKAVETAYETYLDYGNTIQNFSALQKAVASGSMEDMNTAINNLTYSFQTHETATQDMLERQLEDFDTQYKNMQAAVDEGMVGVTQAQVDALKDMRDKAYDELQLSKGVYNEAGQNEALAHAAGLNSPTATAANKGAASKVRGDLIGEMDKTATDMQTKGQQSTVRYAAGVAGASAQAKASGQVIGTAAKTGAAGVDMTSTGISAAGAYASGMATGKDGAYAQGVSVAKKGLAGLSSVSARSVGVDLISGFNSGIGSMAQSAYNAVSRIAHGALDTMRKVFDSHSPSRATASIGVDFDAGLTNSILDGSKDVISAVRTMASGAVKALKTDMQGSAIGIRVNPAGGAYAGGAAGQRAVSSTQNVTFNQTINAPKPVDRLTLYRDTNSLLFSAKVGLTNV